MNYITKQWKILGSISLIGVGAFLIIEHIYSYGGIDLFDLLGHEWFGIVLILAGVLIANRWGRLKMKDGLKYTWKKIKFVFGKS